MFPALRGEGPLRWPFALADLQMKLPPFSPAAARELRASLGYTQQQMADAVLLSRRAGWAEYEGGTETPSPQTWALALIVAGRHPLYALREGAAHGSPSAQP